MQWTLDNTVQPMKHNMKGKIETATDNALAAHDCG